MIGHQTFEVWQTVAQTFMLGVWHTRRQKDWTMNTPSDKFTRTYVDMHTPFASGFTSSIMLK